jgi:hypothetical protein
MRLHSLLRLAPWEPSPLSCEITPLGVLEDDDMSDKSTRRAFELQRELLKLAGWPDCRSAYETNLAEAEEMRDYCAELLHHPERGARGTGDDAVSRWDALREAESEVRYRQRLLDELEAVQQAHKLVGAES